MVDYDRETCYSEGDQIGIYQIDEVTYDKQVEDSDREIQQYLMHDTQTNVCYVLMRSWIEAKNGWYGGWTYSVSPRYNSDGTLMLHQ